MYIDNIVKIVRISEWHEPDHGQQDRGGGGLYAARIYKHKNKNLYIYFGSDLRVRTEGANGNNRID